MADENENERPEWLRRIMADPRYSELPIPCMHCKHIISVGNQFDPEGWTCAAYPTQILYGILTLRTPHTEATPTQPGELVAYDPVIYTEQRTGRRWHYTADARWVYVDEDGAGDEDE